MTMPKRNSTLFFVCFVACIQLAAAVRPITARSRILEEANVLVPAKSKAASKSKGKGIATSSPSQSQAHPTSSPSSYKSYSPSASSPVQATTVPPTVPTMPPTAAQDDPKQDLPTPQPSTQPIAITSNPTLTSTQTPSRSPNGDATAVPGNPTLSPTHKSSKSSTAPSRFLTSAPTCDAQVDPSCSETGQESTPSPTVTTTQDVIVSPSDPTSYVCPGDAPDSSSSTELDTFSSIVEFEYELRLEPTVDLSSVLVFVEDSLAKEVAAVLMNCDGSIRMRRSLVQQIMRVSSLPEDSSLETCGTDCHRVAGSMTLYTSGIDQEIACDALDVLEDSAVMSTTATNVDGVAAMSYQGSNMECNVQVSQAQETSSPLSTGASIGLAMVCALFLAVFLTALRRMYMKRQSRASSDKDLPTLAPSTTMLTTTSASTGQQSHPHRDYWSVVENRTLGDDGTSSVGCSLSTFEGTYPRDNLLPEWDDAPSDEVDSVAMEEMVGSPNEEEPEGFTSKRPAPLDISTGLDSSMEHSIDDLYSERLSLSALLDDSLDDIVSMVQLSEGVAHVVRLKESVSMEDNETGSI